MAPGMIVKHFLNVLHRHLTGTDDVRLVLVVPDDQIDVHRELRSLPAHS